MPMISAADCQKILASNATETQVANLLNSYREAMDLLRQTVSSHSDDCSSTHFWSRTCNCGLSQRQGALIQYNT